MSTNKINKSQASQSIIDSDLSGAVQSILINNLTANTLNGSVGPDVESFPSTETTVALLFVDESPSMSDVVQEVLNQFRLNRDAIKGSHQHDEIVLAVWGFADHSRLIHSYLPIDLVPDLDGEYRTWGSSTAEFDTILEGITSMMTYVKDLVDKGQTVKMNIGVMSDGDDNASKAAASEVKQVVTELRKKYEGITFNLISLGNDVDETDLAESMGFPDPKKFDKTPSGIRRAWGTWSSSVIKTSQTKIGNTSGGLFGP